MNIIFFNAHNCIMQWSCTNLIFDIGIKFRIIVFQIIYWNNAFFPLCCTMKPSQPEKGLFIEVYIKFFIKYLKNIKISKKASQMSSLNPIVCLFCCLQKKSFYFCRIFWRSNISFIYIIQNFDWPTLASQHDYIIA